MQRDSAIELKDKLTEEFRLLGFSLGADPDEQVAATAPIPVGLGLCGGARGEWLLAFRLYADDWTKETRALLATIRYRGPEAIAPESLTMTSEAVDPALGSFVPNLSLTTP